MTPIASGPARRSATAESTPPLIATATRSGDGAAPEDRPDRVRERVDRERLAADRGRLEQAQPAQVGVEPVGVGIDDPVAVEPQPDERPAAVTRRVSGDLDHRSQDGTRRVALRRVAPPSSAPRSEPPPWVGECPLPLRRAYRGNRHADADAERDDCGTTAAAGAAHREDVPRPCRCLRSVANLDEPGGCRAGRLVSRLAEPDSGSLALAVGSTLECGATNRVGHPPTLPGGALPGPGEAPPDRLRRPSARARRRAPASPRSRAAA